MNPDSLEQAVPKRSIVTPTRLFVASAILLLVGVLPLLVAAGPDMPFRVTKVRTLSLKSEPSALAWSPDGKQLAALSKLFTHVTVWDTDTWQTIHEFDISQSMLAANWLSFTPDGRYILVAADPSDVANKHIAATFWNVATGASTQFVTAPFQTDDPKRNMAKVIALSRDGGSLALESNDQRGVQMGLYIGQNWNEPILVSLDQGIIESMDFSPDGQVIAVGTYRGLFCFYDIKINSFVRGSQIYDFNGIGVAALAFSPDGKSIATGYGGPLGNKPNYSVSEPVLLINASTGTVLAKSAASSPKIRSIAWSGDGKILAVGDDNDHVALMIPPLLQKATEDVVLSGPPLSLKFAPNRLVFAVTSAKSLAVYKITSENER